jgi:hypothetical protein
LLFCVAESATVDDIVVEQSTAQESRSVDLEERKRPISVEKRMKVKKVKPTINGAEHVKRDEEQDILEDDTPRAAKKTDKEHKPSKVKAKKRKTEL